MKKKEEMLNKRLIDAFKCHREDSVYSCDDCPYFMADDCINAILSDSLLLSHLLEKRNKENENGYAGTSFLDRCKLHDAEEKIQKLEKEIERLKK